MLDLLTSFFLVVGGLFALIGSIGLARLPDLFMRLHGPTKATTLGVGGILIASMLHFSSLDSGLSLHELLVALFLLITAPVSAHLIARTMIHLRGGTGTVVDEREAGPQQGGTDQR
ncbi:Na+/H+ antiporter subunit G [Desulfoprunum benzoelyticum]|uniref:Multicomponent K+:H+ antiporter subunit G n=1 Tax=Desulfoprunum benzoelyticum TaxID=1506996 RepID=A0A840UNS3_9BACT|nr:Na+/H+ antiporter subunit G [Desulfoprunum benzoelyticum]MBB5347422.1 multicomponent K+:H+ antiporter subunit G [Desulfoprunum benzoelyticum]MBM9529698.1 Na+/H+ antiporter subunit G [Desulfoprunum benzoelyticum]